MAAPAPPWYEVISIPALLRHARHTYGAAMRRALEEAGFGDIPKNGLYVIGGLALGAGDAPLSQLVRDLLDLLDLELAQIIGSADRIEERRFTEAGHGDIPICMSGRAV